MGDESQTAFPNPHHRCWKLLFPVAVYCGSKLASRPLTFSSGRLIQTSNLRQNSYLHMTAQTQKLLSLGRAKMTRGDIRSETRARPRCSACHGSRSPFRTSLFIQSSFTREVSSEKLDARPFLSPHIPWKAAWVALARGLHRRSHNGRKLTAASPKHFHL